MRCARWEDRRAGQDATAARRSEGRSRPRAVAAREGAALGGCSLTRCRGSQTSPCAAPSAADAHEARRRWRRRAVGLLEASPRSLLVAAPSSIGYGSSCPASWRQSISSRRDAIKLEDRARDMLYDISRARERDSFSFFLYFLLYRGKNQNSRIATWGDTKDGPPLPSGFTVYIYLSALIFGRYTGGVRYEMIKMTILIIL